MGSVAANFCIDAADPIAQANWWDQVLDDFTVDPDDDMSEEEAGLRDAGGRWLLFLKVPEPKTIKNRMHLCLRPADSRDAEVDRILGLGATMVDDRRATDSWAVLADPEGNEFCVLDRTASAAGLQ